MKNVRMAVLGKGSPNLSIDLPRAEKRIKLSINVPKPIATQVQSIPSSVIVPFPNQEVRSLSELNKLELLGSGNGGTVYKVRHTETGKLYALKHVHVAGDSQVHVIREVQVLRSCIGYPNIVQCYGVFEEYFGHISILLEYLELGSMDKQLKENGSFSESVVRDIALQLLKGLKHMQDKGIVHRDIKPADLLLTNDLQIKISDFGVSKMASGESGRNTCRGTSAYMSPERLNMELISEGANKCDAGFAGDVWSLGLTLMELYLGRYPYLRSTEAEQLDRASSIWEICYEEAPSLPEDDGASQSFKDFLGCCLNKDWTKRWSVSQLLDHPFLVYDV